MVAVRYARFNAGLVASTDHNWHVAPEDTVSPFDYIPGFFDPTAKEKAKHRRSLQTDVKRALMRVSDDSPERVRAVTKGLINMLRENGVDDPEALIQEVFPEMEI
jgi:hypothetical protein